MRGEKREGTLIRFDRVSKSFGDKQVLRGITFGVHKGECVALLGRSGCGKSTLLKILLGLYKSDAGTITFEGEPIDNRALRMLTGYTSQENSFYDTLTVRENIFYYAARQKTRIDRARALALAKSVRLDHAMDTLAGQLSGGMKRRLDFALSLVHDPMLLILDEPTTGLDPVLVDGFWSLVKEMQEKGKTIIVVTHHLDDVRKHCARAVILKDGKVGKVLDSTADIIEDFGRFS
jgi:ABC-2 type transport system ATP-binding protein